jgi:hypothetical protein
LLSVRADASRAVRALVCDTLRMNEPAPWPRAATYFLCLAKESRQRKARPLRRPLRGCLALLVRGGGRRTRHDRALRARHVPQTAAPLFSASDCAAQRLRGQGRKGSTLPPALSLSRERVNYRAQRERQRPRRAARTPPRRDCSLFPEGRGPGRGASVDLHAIGGAEQRREARRAAFVGTPFFAYFLWQDKESRWPRGHEAERTNEARCSPSASAAGTISNVPWRRAQSGAKERVVGSPRPESGSEGAKRDAHQSGQSARRTTRAADVIPTR